MSKRLGGWLLIISACALATAIGLSYLSLQRAGRQMPAPGATAFSSTPPHTLKATSPPTETPSRALTEMQTALATATVTSTPMVATPTSTPTPTETARLETESLSTDALLAQTEIPSRDLHALTERLKGTGPVPRVVNAEPPYYRLGDKETFWVANLDANENFVISATLRYVSPHLYMWVQNGEEVDDAALARSAQEFEERIYPTNRRYFGHEWNPGVDNDPRLTVLNARFSGAAGYFSSADEYPRLVNPYSNQREMLYINLQARTPGTQDYASTLAHEFQHMVHWHADPDEETWLNEGASQVAEVLNGFPPPEIIAFADDPDIQLNAWADLPSAAGAHYEASYLMVAYFLQRFGPDMLREVIQHPANGAKSFDAVLAEHGAGLTFEDLFADWVIANYLDDVSIAQTRYGYQDIDLHIKPARVHQSYPVIEEGQVHQFAADYIVLEPGTLSPNAALPEARDIRVSFTGTLTVPLIPNQAHSGRYQWWSNRGDSSDMTLTRAFDLRGLEEATLQCWLWYDIEEGWDYAYIEVSTDQGKTWRTLPGRYTTLFNPNGQSFGHAYTGLSGGDTARWIEEEIDLTPYVGQEVLIRFEYITDDAVNRPGFCVDDIRLPQLNYLHDAEQGDDGWLAEGFVRIDNVMPQRFLVQVITLGEKVTAQRMSIDENRRGYLDIRGFGQEIERAVLVISGLTPVTTEIASYRYAVTPLTRP